MGKKSTTTTTQTVTEAQAEAYQKEAELAKQAQSWYETEMFPWLQEATETANKNAVTDAAQAKENYQWIRDYYKQQSDFQNGVSDELYNRYQQDYVPVEDRMLEQAQNFNEDAYADRRAAYAIGDLSNSYKQQRAELENSMQAAGYDPTSGKYQAAMASLNDQQAYAQAAAAYTAQEEARNLGWDRQYYAANQGQQYLSNALNTANNATSVVGSTASQMSGALANATNYSQASLNQISNLAQLGVNNYSQLSSAWSNYGNLATGISNSNSQASVNNSQSSANAYGTTAGLIAGGISTGVAAGAAYNKNVASKSGGTQ